MKRPTNGSTPKQYAYAMRKLNGDGESNKEIARLVGYSPGIADNTKNKIESTHGYHNAMHALALESNNMMLAVMSEFKVRGFKEYDTQELMQVIDVMGKAWDRFNKRNEPPKKKENTGDNPLVGVLIREPSQTIDVTAEEVTEIPQEAPKEAGPMPEFYKEAINLIRQEGKASTSYFQRSLGIGYAKAASVMDALEGNLIIGKADGSKPRKILVKFDKVDLDF